MKKGRMGILIFFFIFSLTLFSMISIAKSEVVNGDFEETLVVPEKDSRYKIVEALNFKIESPLVLPVGWELNLVASAKDGEFRLISDKSQAQKGNNCIYLKGHLMTPKSIDVNPGDEFDISLYVKNSSKSDVYVYLYCYTKTEEGRLTGIGSLDFKTETEIEWTKRTGKINIPEEVGGKKLKAVIVALSNKTGAYIDNVEIVKRAVETK